VAASIELQLRQHQYPVLYSLPGEAQDMTPGTAPTAPLVEHTQRATGGANGRADTGRCKDCRDQLSALVYGAMLIRANKKGSLSEEASL